MMQGWRYVGLLIFATCSWSLRVKRGEPENNSPSSKEGPQSGTATIQMPGALPNFTDSYLCTSFSLDEILPQNVKDPIYITKFEPFQAVSEKAHHLLLYTCQYPNSQPIWNCAHHRTCEGGQSGIIFAWAKNAEGVALPKDVGVELSRFETRNLVMQVHYAVPLEEKDFTGLKLHYQSQKTKYLSGIHLMGAMGPPIPPNTPSFQTDSNCRIGQKMHPFAFRTHAHSLGVVIVGYKYSPDTKEFTEIAKGNPQWPQAFYPTKKIETVEKGDFLVARCTYNSIGRNRTTHIGGTAGDEMCNLYIMYYVEEGNASFRTCWSVQDEEIMSKIPADSTTPLPPNPLLEEHAKHSRVKGDLEELEPQDGKDEGKGKRRKGDLEDDLDQVPGLNEGVIELKMPGSEPKQDDEYFCTAFDVSKLTNNSKVYVTGFSADATAKKAHHLILQKCEKPVKLQEGEIWNCRHHATCRGNSKIVYAWAKDAPPTNLPNDVGFKIEPSDGYLVLQVHYAHGLEEKDYTGLHLKTQTQRPKYLAGIFLLLRSYLSIPPHHRKVHGDVNCRVEKPVTLFAYRTHAHSLGAVITGYKIEEGEFKEVARGDPQKPQTFYPMKKFATVNKGDYLAARCTFDSSKKNKTVHIGATAGDEMCNLYLMYYTDQDNDGMRLCIDEEITSLSKSYPQDSDWTTSELQNGHKSEEIPLSYNNGNGVLANEIAGSPKEKKNEKNMAKDDARKGKNKKDSKLYPVPNWPTPETAKLLGQVSGVAIDTLGNPVIFHRGDRTWNGNTFKRNNVYNGNFNDPIKANTILTLNSTGHVINEWGTDLFFMPHMITVDSKNNVWVTDVALHQVFKFGPYGGRNYKPLFTLGEAFVPGSDSDHFCKPTCVAVTADHSSFYVADGYCNSRIIKYSLTFNGRTGGYNVAQLIHWGEANGAGFSITRSPYAFNIPHSLALAEDKKLICVADRENSRIQCFNLDGKFVKTLQPSGLGRPYAIAYSATDGGNIYAVNGPDPFGAVTGLKAEGLVIDINTGNLKSHFNANGKGFENPHALAVSKAGDTIYETELNPFKVWKLTNGQNDSLVQIHPVPAVPNSDSFDVNIKKITNIVPTSTLGVSAALGSLLLTCVISTCLACRRWRKRGKGTMTKSMSNGKKKSRKDGKLDLGDLLGRSKEGFQPLKTDEYEEEENVVSSDSDDLEEFSVPALRA